MQLKQLNSGQFFDNRYMNHLTSPKFWFSFIGAYIAQIGAVWGILEAYTYFQGDSLKLALGNYWPIIYALPIFTALLFANSREDVPNTDSRRQIIKGKRIKGEIVGNNVTITNYFASTKPVNTPLLPQEVIDQVTHGIPQPTNPSPTSEILRLPKMQNGDLYIERFLIKGHMGQGGFSDVYLAWDEANPDIGEVVLKLYRYDGQPSYVKHLIEREATVSRIFSNEHQGLVKTYSANWLPSNFGFYLVQEYVSSMNLHQYIESKITLDQDEALDIAIRIAKTLNYIHHNRLVHCDVKPLNILLTANRKPLLIDFGTARFLEEPFEQHNIVVSIPYSPKELMDGNPVDGRSDIYSLGMTLLHMLAGLPIWIKSSRKHIDYQTLAIAPNPLSVIPTDEEVRTYIQRSFYYLRNDELIVCLRKSLEIDPDQRFETMAAMTKELIRCRKNIAT